MNRHKCGHIEDRMRGPVRVGRGVVAVIGESTATGRDVLRGRLAGGQQRGRVEALDRELHNAALRDREGPGEVVIEGPVVPSRDGLRRVRGDHVGLCGRGVE